METQYISLNMTPTGVNPCFHISQYDVGRMLGFIVHSGGATVDLDTYTCTIEATRSDGTAITSAVATTDNIGTFEVTPTMSNKADKYRCQLIIVDENSKRIASLPFDMEVTKAAMDENSEAIEEDASLYQQYTEAVQGAIAEANADIQAEENARIAAVAAEATARANAITAEATARQTADNTLQGNINSEASTRASADSNLQSQINQIVAPSGEAPSAAEVQNARIGADGVTYSTLGNAIRRQVSDLQNDLNNKLFIDELVLGISDFYSGNILPDGSIVSGVNANYYSRLIKKSEYKHLHIGVAYGYSQLLSVAYYNNGLFVSRDSTWLAAGEALDIDNEYDVRILIAKNAESSVDISEQIGHYTFDILRENFYEFKDAITKECTISESDFEAGGISTTGAFTTKTASNCRSRLILKNEFKHITIHAKNGQHVLFAYALYDDNFEFVSRSAYYAEGRCVVINNNYNVRITIADIENVNNYTISEMVEKCDINLVKEGMKNTDFTKYMHLSFDDVETCFGNLISNSYLSLFDEPFFGFLQYLHITYGTKISLYLQNIAQLASVPNTYAEDFTQNAEWLKVGFHAYERGSLADTEEDAKAHYNTFASEISRICGTTNCIDRLPRLNYFSGNSEGVRGLIKANSGIIGLLGADDNRYQYYLANSQLAYLRGHSLLYDDVNHIAFISTIMRLDWFIDGFSSQYEYNTPVENNPYDELVYRCGQPNMGNLYNSLIIFTHEWRIYNGSALNANSNLVHDACKFAHDYGYSFDYPQNRVDDITSLNVYDNLFDYESAQSLNLFINTSNMKFGTPASGQNYKLVVFRCRGNASYRITKVAGKTFRMATSADIPANGVSFLSTVANHTGTEIDVLTESNARFIGICYWSDANGDMDDYESLKKSIKIVTNN